MAVSTANAFLPVNWIVTTTMGVPTIVAIRSQAASMMRMTRRVVMAMSAHRQIRVLLVGV